MKSFCYVWRVHEQQSAALKLILVKHASNKPKHGILSNACQDHLSSKIVALKLHIILNLASHLRHAINCMTNIYMLVEYVTFCVGVTILPVQV